MNSLDRPNSGERVIVVHVDFSFGKMKEDYEELCTLARSAGALLVGSVTGARSAPDAKYFIGLGKAEEVAALVKSQDAHLVIFNHALSPGQERNLERLIHCRVLDRTGLILDIFAKRARSFEGQLQVELALLSHLSTRLIRGWTHLERQRGGIGLRGPGETQLEVDRRLIKNKIKLIRERLQKIRKQREQSRRSRHKASLPTIALVGYTNAGKSTLFNRLTGASVYVADQLFATLDPTLRRTTIPNIGSVIFADTVGFIRHLPHDLIEAFHATLEEVSEADLLLHVVDASDDERVAHIEQVEAVLQMIHAENVPRILVYNKIDNVPLLSPLVEYDENHCVRRVFVSAAANHGIDLLQQAISETLHTDMIEHRMVLSPSQGKIRAKLFQDAVVIEESYDDEGLCYLTLKLPKRELVKLFAGKRSLDPTEE